jgi:hypothetical protein
MAKSDRPLTVDIPRPGADQPVWSRVGLIGLLGFVVGIAWPRVAGVKIGPAVPADLAARVEASASPSAAPPSAARARASASASASAAPPASTASAAASADEDAPPAANQEMVVVGPGKIVKCSDKKDKKIDDCEKLLFDPIAVKRLRSLTRCPSAAGLTGKMNVVIEVDFGKKEVGIKKTKKGNSLPSSTVAGIVQCAARDFANASLEEVPHKHRRYTLEYGLSFYGPGKHPEGAAAESGGDDPAAGSTTSEAEASGTATVAWDTALVRKEPKDGEIVARLVRGTKVKIVGKQNDWYKIESGSKTGWVYRGMIGL